MLRSIVLTHGKSRYEIVHCECLQMGNNSASIATTALLMLYPTITDVLMVGIAGGVPHHPFDLKHADAPDHVRLGDIVFADEVYQYDMIKRERAADTNRAKPRPASALFQKAYTRLSQKEFDKKAPWTKHVARVSRTHSEFKRPVSDELHVFSISDLGVITDTIVTHPPQIRRKANTAPLVHKGRVGSANILLKDDVTRNALRSLGIRAVEMEGSGVADATWNFDVGYGIVRGICDYCDPIKNETWQLYAALAAAAFSRAVIEVSV
ncbi:MAG: hypothetical protein HY834_20430 [Devosia nanyangense]|uniref:Nucleoside phosphorylase domain-containing protein n=1 Tax=Devosia nanyangense TaxID=1228055 RepID=A0A933NYM3_9HYPH|nr:hypothetical protein [Devosia nanyangense]